MNNRLRHLLILTVSLFATPGVCVAAEPARAAQGGGLALIDWLILIIYAGATIALGWYFSRRQETTQEYFVGSGQMNPILIGVSLFATLLSTISYLSIPGETLGKGPIFMSSILMYPVIFLIVGFVLLPVYMRQRVTSAYELLEAKLGLSVRLLGTGMFLCLRLVWMSLLMYLTGKAMAVMMGIDPKWIPLIVLITGFVAITYTTLGGLRAVVITDLMQTVLLYGGAVLVIATVTIKLGGFDWIPTQWNPNWDTQPIFPKDASTRVSMLGSFISVLIWYVCTSGGDQVSVQRFMATRDAKAARCAFATQLCVAVVVLFTLALAGFSLLAYFEANPGLLPEGMSLKENADDIFPRFITFHLPPGISGLVVAAMFAAAMSSIDSGVNSITAVVTTDLMDRFGRAPATEREHVRLARIMAFVIGAVVVACSSLMQHVPGNITAVTQKTSNLLTVPIFCLFFFALFVPFATPVGAWVGTVCSVITAVLVAFSGPIFGVNPETGLDPISFQWISPCALAVGIAVGLPVCWFTSRKNTPAAPGSDPS